MIHKKHTNITNDAPKENYQPLKCIFKHEKKEMTNTMLLQDYVISFRKLE